MTENTSAEHLRSLLQTIENDRSQSSRKKADIRASVLASFDRALAEPPQPEILELIELADAENEQRRTAPTRRAVIWLAGAAAAVMIVLGTLTLGTQLGLETNEPAAQPDALRLAEDPDGREVLLQGRQRTESIGGGLSFVAPAGLTVSTQQDGLLVLEPDDPLAGVISQLVIAEVPLGDWLSELDELAEGGLVQAKEIGISVGGTPTTRYDVTISDALAAERACDTAAPCVRLEGWPTEGPVAFWTGTDNRTVEIGRTETTVVLGIEITERFPDPISALATSLLASATLDTP